MQAPLPEETEEAEEGAEVAEGAEGAAEGANESMTDERRAEIADAMMPTPASVENSVGF